jgi:hypothetical protein
MLVNSFNPSQSFNYFFYKKTVQIRDQFFLFTDPEDIIFMWTGRRHATSLLHKVKYARRESRGRGVSPPRTEPRGAGGAPELGVGGGR